jgi:hypothetical protein
MKVPEEIFKLIKQTAIIESTESSFRDGHAICHYKFGEQVP